MQKTIEINGTEYTLQRISNTEWLKMQERATDRRGNISVLKFSKEILEHILVEPRMKIDDFETTAEMEEVVAEAVNFQHGKDLI